MTFGRSKDKVCLCWCFIVLLFTTVLTEVRGQSTSLVKMPAARRPNGINALMFGALGGGLGAALGSVDGSVRAATLGAAGGCLGGLIGGLVDDSDGITPVLGAVTYGYVGGLLGGFVGGTTGRVADTLATVGTSAIVGFGGGMVGNEAYGTPGAVVGTIGGLFVGAGIGKVIIGPVATIVASGAFGAIGAGAGSYLGSTDFVGRPR